MNGRIKMKQLYSVCTYYQLITAIQIKVKIYPNAIADVIINDLSNDYLKIIERLKNLNVFRNVFTATFWQKSNLITKTKKAVNILINNNSYAEKCCDINVWDYDEFLFYSYSYFNSCLYYTLKKRNPQIAYKRFEEGYICSIVFNLSIPTSVYMQHMLEKYYNHTDIFDVDEAFFYEPDLVLVADKYKKMTAIPKLDRNDTEIISILNSVFDYSNTVDEYDKKYIFFEQCFLDDGIEMDDLDLILKIADKVGRENLMVKLHPRSKSDRFIEYGIKTNKNTSVPWEVIIMNNNFSDKVFLTITSGSVLSPRIIFEDKFPTYMLFNCTKSESKIVTDKYYEYLTKFKNKYNDGNFYIPESYEEFLKIL